VHVTNLLIFLTLYINKECYIQFLQTRQCNLYNGRSHHTCLVHNKHVLYLGAILELQVPGIKDSVGNDLPDFLRDDPGVGPPVLGHPDVVRVVLTVPVVVQPNTRHLLQLLLWIKLSAKVKWCQVIFSTMDGNIFYQIKSFSSICLKTFSFI